MKHLMLAVLLALSIGCASNPVLVASPIAPSPLPPDHTSMVTKALKSVAHMKGIEVGEDGFPHGYGCSAFAIAPRKFLTADHCVGDTMEIDGQAGFAFKRSHELDLALLLVDDSRAPLGIRVNPLAFLEHVTALGYGYSWAFPTITSHRAIIFKFSPDPNIFPGTWFENPFIGGMSGGPIVDDEGYVVGVVQMSSNHSGYGVDSDAIVAFLNQ